MPDNQYRALSVDNAIGSFQKSPHKPLKKLEFNPNPQLLKILVHFFYYHMCAPSLLAEVSICAGVCPLWTAEIFSIGRATHPWSAAWKTLIWDSIFSALHYGNPYPRPVSNSALFKPRSDIGWLIEGFKLMVCNLLVILAQMVKKAFKFTVLRSEICLHGLQAVQKSISVCIMCRIPVSDIR